MKKYAIVGDIASGKSFFSKILRIQGDLVLDLDKLGKFISLKNELVREKFIENFGREILDKEGFVSREKLREIAFANQENLEKLNSIVHPLLREKLLDILKNIKNRDRVFVEGAIIIEAGFSDIFDKIILIRTSVENQKKRLMSRNNVSQEQSEQMIFLQKNKIDKEKIADYILENNGLKEEFSDKILEFMENLD